MKETLRGRFRTGGIVEAIAIVSDEPFGFWQGIDPETGIIVNRRHALYGQSIGGKAFVFPYGRGSTGNPGVFLEAVRNDVAPAAMINLRSEPMLVVCALLAEACYGKKVPVVDNLTQDPLRTIRTGDTLRIDGDSGEITVIRDEGGSSPGAE